MDLYFLRLEQNSRRFDDDADSILVAWEAVVDIVNPEESEKNWETFLLVVREVQSMICMRAGTLGYFNSVVAISPGRPCNEKSNLSY